MLFLRSFFSVPLLTLNFFFVYDRDIFKALANEDTLLRTHCCRHKCFPVCPRAQHCCRHKFCVRNKCFPVCAAQETSWVTMCPRLPGPLDLLSSSAIFGKCSAFKTIVENLRKVVGKLGKIVKNVIILIVCLYNKQNNTRLLLDMEFKLDISRVSAALKYGRADEQLYLMSVCVLCRAITLASRISFN